ncbi:hypothetical protein X766_03940 [Mesorhizobium sp. LSJC255A00]|uniref:hypothetical protein n=1 Tax=Mesorhizobium sp. LSJC255A00 TaxID=1287313 RepID=UPI0003CF8CE9|nr:hypothetical protein [Mesorhizobium sp. LSJC255A00]ESX22247.1 hypothetical protein X766_03940 [Mesorhizobium sp. LSJC255A00]
MKVAALAGRRVDADDAAVERFPLRNVDAVAKEIRSLLLREDVGILVCAAASGADLIALRASISDGRRCRVVLPFDTGTFRRISVEDRPGDWGATFDSVIHSVKAAGDLIVLNLDEHDLEGAFTQTNREIIDEAKRLAEDRAETLAILVWEGQSRGIGDSTAEFGRLAQESGIPRLEIMTMAP